MLLYKLCAGHFIPDGFIAALKGSYPSCDGQQRNTSTIFTNKPVIFRKYSYMCLILQIFYTSVVLFCLRLYKNYNLSCVLVENFLS
jgi:hypothetical protein